jgi:type IV secretion system protein VirD4
MTGPRRSQFSKIIKFAPGETESCRWNPLAAVELPTDWIGKETTIDRICVSLFVLSDESDMWTREARSIFMFWTLYLINKNGETTFSEIIESALASGDPQEIIAEVLDSNSNLPPRIVTEGNGLMAKGDKEFAGCLGTFKSNMNIFLDANVRRNTGASDFSLWSLRKECTTVYLCVQPSDQLRLAKLLALFFETAYTCFLDHIPTQDELPVTLMLDEYPQLGKMVQINGMPAIGRGYKFNAFYICQSFNQLVAKYGDAGANELKNTCSYHIFYTQNEIRVAEEISKSIGKFTRKKTSHSSQSGSMSKNTSESDEGVPLILPQEIMSLPFGEILVCAQGNFQTPVKCNAALFFKIPSLQQAIKNSSWDEKNKVSMTSATPEALPASLAPVENKPEGVEQENNFNDEQEEVA